jgi:hypothetical protein
VAAARDVLRAQRLRVSADAWPAGLRHLDSPGLYSWWVDDRGAIDLSTGLGHPVVAGRIYAGQKGRAAVANNWPEAA